jgi:hypothetical protein
MHVSAIRFGGSHVVPEGRSSRWALSSRRDACVPSLWHPCRLSRDAVTVRTFTGHVESRRDRRQSARVNERTGTTIGGVFHRAKASAPRRPFERPARACPGSAAWPPRCRSSTPLIPRERPLFGAFPGAWVPVHTPRLPAGTCFSEPRASFADFCNRCRRAGTPFELSIFAREWGFRPATRRHQPMPVALAGPPRCRGGGLRTACCRAPAFARCTPLTWKEQHAGRDVREKTSRALLTMSRVPSS